MVWHRNVSKQCDRRYCWDEDSGLQGAMDCHYVSFYQYDTGGERTYKLTGKKKALRADKKVKTIAGRLLRELERHLKDRKLYDIHAKRLELRNRVIIQRKEDKNKLYSIHEPEVLCISKGKEHKKYEFGNKVSIVRTEGGIIIGAKSFRNEYDGHTIDPALEQVKRLTGRTLKVLACDRGYRGQKMSGTTHVVIPDTPKANDSYYKRRKKHELFCKRAA